MTGDGPSPRTVLVVEDSTVNRRVLAKGVEREGHRVLQAEDGAAALDLLARHHVDMVLLDLLMPEVSGFDVLERMGNDAELRDIPVLVISAVEASEDVARALELGAIDCLPKPVDAVLLRVRLRTALEQARLRRLEQDYLRQELALRQQERLATLGRLSAGLGHELNNPAAAALSTARQLRQALTTSDQLLVELCASPRGPAILEAAGRLGPSAAPPESGIDRDEVEDQLAVAFQRLGVPEPWNHAAELAELGVTAADLEASVGHLGADAALAVRWLQARGRLGRGVDHIERSVARMAELTSALRGYSYLDRAPQQELAVRRGLDDTVTILRHKLPDAVQVVREDDDELPTIHAFGGQLNQVWTNLLDNAIDAVGDRGRVTIRARRASNGIVVEVEDDGPGIPPELQGRVFDPFVTTKPPGSGTGLGLSISHQIVVDRHGGSIELDSAPGSTIFRVRLPLRPPEEDPDEG